VRSHLDDLVLSHTVVREFVVKAFRDQFQHLIALLPAGDFFVALLVHPCASRTISTSRDSFKFKKRSQLFIRANDETLPVAVMRVSNPDCSSLTSKG
jgi:hypothetical protein